VRDPDKTEVEGSIPIIL